MTREVTADVFIVKTRTYPFQGWDFEGCYATRELAEEVTAFYFSMMRTIPGGVDRKIEEARVIVAETPA